MGCNHEFRNVGFHTKQMACKHCGYPMPLAVAPTQVLKISNDIDPAAKTMNEVMVVPKDGIQFCYLPILRGFTEVSMLHGLAKSYGAVIAGGYAKFCASPTEFPHKTSDVDIFPGKASDASKIVEELKERGFVLASESAYSFTMDPPPMTKTDTTESIRWKSYRNHVQIIKSDFLGNKGWRGVGEFEGFEDLARQVLSTFDTPIVRVAIVGPDKVIADARFWQDEVERKMTIEGFRNASFLFHRISKYAAHGYQFDEGSIVAMYEAHCKTDAQREVAPALKDKLAKIKSSPKSQAKQYKNEDSGAGVTYND